MGIPSYFAYIIKHHQTIIKKQKDFTNNRIHRLYMDCNSILYDVFNQYHKHQDSNESLEKIILEKTKEKIDYYIKKLRPSDIIYIAFDGVAPFAKMEQQRNRRYKSWFQNKLFSKNETNKFTSSIFTPGTHFMESLSKYMKTNFEKQENKYFVNQIIVSTPNEYGEGEHKLYEHIRKNPHKNQNMCIYGLDADLIMLSLFHVQYSQNIYVFREAPEFISILSEDKKEIYNPHDLWFLDIQKLGNSISSEMECSYPSPKRMYDYVFLCFFLGNDFLPHFPALNIRTNGMQRLLDTYRLCIGSYAEKYLVDIEQNKINWKEVSKFIESLAKNEHVFILQEYSHRNKWINKKFAQTTDKEKEEYFQSSPIVFRQEELYIYPQENGWENRYYKTLFTPNTQNTNIKEYVNNYLEGLEWVFYYYNSGCIDWKWHYKYHYPPLLQDISKEISNYKTGSFFKNNKPFSSNAQLAYVLPYQQLELLPEKIGNILKTKYSEYYPKMNETLTFQWAFCRYFWESHVCLPEISVELLENWEKEIA